MISIKDNFNLSDYNTFAMHVYCNRFLEYTSSADIQNFMPLIETAKRYIHIGGGSNLLFTGDYDGIVIHSKIDEEEVIDENDSEIVIRVGAGVKMDDFILRCCEKSLWGLENLSGIPGETGASAVQNVGAYGVEAGDRIEAVHVYDTEEKAFKTIEKKECRYEYRHSIFKNKDVKGRYIIHSVDYRLYKKACPNVSYPALKNKFTHISTDDLNPLKVRAAIIEIRDSKLPSPDRIPSAGSFFKNPVISVVHFEDICKNEGAESSVPHYKVENGVKIPAAWLIDRCGWKGKIEGNVEVWPLQPLVIVNPHRKAMPEEIIKLENKIIDSVKSRFGIVLTPEVEHI